MAFTVTKNLMLPATVTGSWPRPRWFDVSMWAKPLDTCMMDIRFREIKLTVYGLGDYAFVDTAEGHAILFKEGHSVVTVFAAHQQLQEGLTKTLKAVTGKAAKWRKGELVTFKASE